MPKVSVIVPVYNKEKYIEATFASVLNQPFRDLEVIAVNDGSRDGSLAALKALAERDERIRIVDIPNGGVSNARNVGLSHAAGEWIQFLDADDQLETDYLCRAVPAAEEAGVDILFSGFSKINEQGEILERVSVPAGEMNQIQLCQMFIRWQYTNGFFGFISNKLFRRSLWQASGAEFPVGTTLAEDLDFFVRMYPWVQRACVWEGSSFSYLQTEENYMNRAAVNYPSQLMIHMDVRAWFQKSGLYEENKNVFDEKISQYAYFTLFHHEESGLSVEDAFYFLTERPEVMACVNPALVEGFARKLLVALKRNNLNTIKSLLKGRLMLRNLYRMVRKNG